MNKLMKAEMSIECCQNGMKPASFDGMSRGQFVTGRNVNAEIRPIKWVEVALEEPQVYHRLPCSKCVRQGPATWG
jgi:hypothetical protein